MPRRKTQKVTTMRQQRVATKPKRQPALAVTVVMLPKGKPSK